MKRVPAKNARPAVVAAATVAVVAAVAAEIVAAAAVAVAVIATGAKLSAKFFQTIARKGGGFLFALRCSLVRPMGGMGRIGRMKTNPLLHKFAGVQNAARVEGRFYLTMELSQPG